MKRSNTHIAMGLGFVSAAVLVAGSLYVGLKAGASVEQRPAAVNEFAAVPENTALLENEAAPVAVYDDVRAAELQGDRVDPRLPPAKSLVTHYYSELVNGDDRCEGNRWSFEPDGAFEVVFLRNKEVISGRWTLDGESLSVSNLQSSEAEGTPSNSKDEVLELKWSNGALSFGEIKLHPCGM